MSDVTKMFIQIEKNLIVNLHNFCKQECDKHVPYAVIKQEYRRAFVKWMKKENLKQTFGLVGEMISTEEIITTLYAETSKRLIKKYKFDKKAFFA